MQAFDERQARRIGERMAALAGVAPFEADISQGDGLTVRVSSGRASIAACDRSALARGYFMAARAIRTGEALSVSQTRHFRECGAMIDMSRGGVMNPQSVKHTIEVMAALGMNMLQLYTEDTYTVPEYPYFGYLRGRYTPQELRELDDYADAFGVELIPCIQTLAHLGQFLQWSENSELKDQPTVLMIDDERTYAFIEAEIKAVRGCFRSKQIHIGMDEAHGVGLGRYFEKHGLTDRLALLNRHLGRVVDICGKYDFHPMMWSDMFFRLGSKTNSYSDPQARVPDSVIADMPDVRMVYWDYYTTDPSMYDVMFREHARMRPDTVFAGGLWTWAGFLPQIARTRATMRPALTKSLEYGVETVMATMWGDDGTETCYSLAYSLYPLFSETCWTGRVPTDEEASALGEAVSGVPRDAFEAWTNFYTGYIDRRNGKGYLYGDLLYPLVVNDESAAQCAARCYAGCEALAPYMANERCAYACHVMRLASHKAEIISKFRERYLAGDRAYLQSVAETEIPLLLTELDTLRRAHRALWQKEFKRNGWETLALRYGAVEGRLKDVQTAIREYLDGTLATLAELDEQPLPSWRKSGNQFYETFVSPNYGSI